MLEGISEREMEIIDNYINSLIDLINKKYFSKHRAYEEYKKMVKEIIEITGADYEKLIKYGAEKLEI